MTQAAAKRRARPKLNKDYRYGRPIANYSARRDDSSGRPPGLFKQFIDGVAIAQSYFDHRPMQRLQTCLFRLFCLFYQQNKYKTCSYRQRNTVNNIMNTALLQHQDLCSSMRVLYGSINSNTIIVLALDSASCLMYSTCTLCHKNQDTTLMVIILSNVTTDFNNYSFSDTPINKFAAKDPISA